MTLTGQEEIDITGTDLKRSLEYLKYTVFQDDKVDFIHALIELYDRDRNTDYLLHEVNKSLDKVKIELDKSENIFSKMWYEHEIALYTILKNLLTYFIKHGRIPDDYYTIHKRYKGGSDIIWDIEEESKTWLNY